MVMARVENSLVPLPGNVTIMTASEDGRAYTHVQIDRGMLEDEELCATAIKSVLERLDEALANLTRGGRTP
jgi:hypothetical protein